MCAHYQSQMTLIEEQVAPCVVHFKGNVTVRISIECVDVLYPAGTLPT